MPEKSDPVQDLLLDAFERDVRSAPVDEHRLTAGTHGVLRHRRRVRRAQLLAAALLVVAAVPLTVQLWPGSGVRTVPARPAPTQPGPTPPDPTPTTTPPASLGSALPLDVPLPQVPGVGAAIPSPLTFLTDSGPYREELSPLAGLGVQCDMNSTAPRTIAAQEFIWVDQTSVDPDQMGVTLRLTRWAPGDAAAAFADAPDGSGACGFAHVLEPFDLSVAGADESWAAVTDSDATTRGTAFTQVSGIARVGDVLVGVSVQGPVPDRSEELATVLTAAVADVRASGG